MIFSTRKLHVFLWVINKQNKTIKKKTAEPVCSPVLSPHYHTCHTWDSRPKLQLWNRGKRHPVCFFLTVVVFFQKFSCCCLFYLQVCWAWLWRSNKRSRLLFSPLSPDDPRSQRAHNCSGVCSRRPVPRHLLQLRQPPLLLAGKDCSWEPNSSVSHS